MSVVPVCHYSCKNSDTVLWRWIISSMDNKIMFFCLIHGWMGLSSDYNWPVGYSRWSNIHSQKGDLEAIAVTWFHIIKNYIQHFFILLFSKLKGFLVNNTALQWEDFSITLFFMYFLPLNWKTAVKNVLHALLNI